MSIRQNTLITFSVMSAHAYTNQTAPLSLLMQKAGSMITHIISMIDTNGTMPTVQMDLELDTDQVTLNVSIGLSEEGNHLDHKIEKSMVQAVADVRSVLVEHGKGYRHPFLGSYIQMSYPEIYTF